MGCELRFEQQGTELAWTEPCGRADLPAQASVRREDPPRVYDVSGGEGTDAVWWLRDPGTHPGLYELWVFPTDAVVLDRSTYGADQVIPMWSAEDEVRGDGAVVIR